MVPCFDGHIRPPETYISKFKFSKLTLLQHMYKYAQVYGWKFALPDPGLLQSLERQWYWNPSPEQINVTGSSVSRNKENKEVKLL